MSDRLKHLDWPQPSPLGPLWPVGEQPRRELIPPRSDAAEGDKLLATLDAVFDAFDIQDGATLSFHHHYRNGDRLLNAVMAVAAARGLRDLTLAPSSLFPVHAPLVAYIRSGVVTRIVTDYVTGPVAGALEALAVPLLLQTHGGRARAITTGHLRIDAAFVAAAQVSRTGDATGRIGGNACGPLGYAAVDAAHARRTVICAPEVTPLPPALIDIPARNVDAVVRMDAVGDAAGIASATTLAAATPQARAVAERVADVAEAAGVLRPGMALQSGAGGYSLGAVPELGRRIGAKGICGSFISGGITAAHVALRRAGLFDRIEDVQSFDPQAAQSSGSDPRHRMMDAARYASVCHPAPVVDALSLMLLGAAQIDAGFNVNVTTDARGGVIGGPGGHPDAAEGADLRIVTTGLTAAGQPKLVDKVRCVTTPGGRIDVLVTPEGVCVHPARADLAKDLRRAGIIPLAFGDLQRMGPDARAIPQNDPPHQARVLIEDRHGGVLDWA
ncbi:citrate lyase subunit alpha [Sulfitobacter sp. S190]|uniref:citrate lyase subunit alpha n=1 Tax=Sulfitobacter sp. S190 TaxID=2867022 RepID=UPI0021A565C4|nr:citrate lyase subunit alpha [Sulfitobacter sp. S190]UWR21920.1 citrate CoA-transferase [Sulfitobacter sp. S190]